MTYKPITEYSVEELAAMRPWEVLATFEIWKHTVDPDNKSMYGELPEPFAAVFDTAHAAFEHWDENDPQFNALVDEHYEQVFPPGTPYA